MDAVHIVVFKDFPGNFQQVLLHLRLTGIKIQAAITVKDYGICKLMGWMVCAELRKSSIAGISCRAGDSIRIEPCMQLQTIGVALLNKISEGVKAAGRRLSLLTGEYTAPGHDFRSIQRIGGRPHLQENGCHIPLDSL